MTGYVYAIAAGDRVKIGWSSDPFRRLNKIRSDCPSDAMLIGVIAATRKQEAEIHIALHAWRRNGEWFEHVGPVRAFVEMLPAPGPRSLNRTWKSARTNHPLARWIDARMSRLAFAREVGVRSNHLSMILSRKRGASLELAVAIEKKTFGVITAEVMAIEGVAVQSVKAAQ